MKDGFVREARGRASRMVVATEGSNALESRTDLVRERRGCEYGASCTKEGNVKEVLQMTIHDKDIQ